MATVAVVARAAAAMATVAVVAGLMPATAAPRMED